MYQIRVKTTPVLLQGSDHILRNIHKVFLCTKKVIGGIDYYFNVITKVEVKGELHEGRTNTYPKYI